jgi:hypothetical protein
MSRTQTAQRQQEEAPQIPTGPLKAFIHARLARNETPAQIAFAVKHHLGIEIDRAHVIPYWKGEITLPTQTGHRQDDDKSVQFPADEEKEPLFTRMADGETVHLMSEAVAPAPLSIALDPSPVPGGARGEDAPANADRTQTG